MYPHLILDRPYGLLHNPTLCAGGVKLYLYICAAEPIWGLAFLGLKCCKAHMGRPFTKIIKSLHKIDI